MKPQCPGCRAGSPSIVRDGHFFRQCDSRRIQRFRCKTCGRGFSAATHSNRYRQKCRRINPRLQELMCVGGLSQRDLARHLNISRTTLVRRVRFIAEEARARQQRLLQQRVAQSGRFQRLQFDDLHTFEHTKCKPTAVGVLVEEGSRFILGSYVAQIPASGPLAAISRKKYGPREDLSGKARHELFAQLKSVVSPYADWATDEHARYPAAIKKHFPKATHRQYKSIRGCVTGQGELKKTQFDPLFSINHTLAMLRAKINRLVRRTWCTTKKNERLEDHMALYVDYHNRILIHSPAT